jgi:hypothetical protein
MLQTYTYRHKEANGIPTNGVTLPLRPDGVDRIKQNKDVAHTLRQQMQIQRSEKDIEIINKFKEEVRQNKKMQNL